MSTSDNASVPNVKRTNYDITYVEDDDYADLISTTGEQGDQIKLDDSDVCREVRRLCEEGNGASVIVVEAMGEIAIASCTELRPVDGLNILSDIKNSPQYNNIKIIMISADATTKIKSRCMNLGADGYISKPINVLELVR